MSVFMSQIHINFERVNFKTHLRLLNQLLQPNLSKSRFYQNSILIRLSYCYFNIVYLLFS